jgi:hypothetical protein
MAIQLRLLAVLTRLQSRAIIMKHTLNGRAFLPCQLLRQLKRIFGVHRFADNHYLTSM